MRFGDWVLGAGVHWTSWTIGVSLVDRAILVHVFALKLCLLRAPECRRCLDELTTYELQLDQRRLCGLCRYAETQAKAEAAKRGRAAS